MVLVLELIILIFLQLFPVNSAQVCTGFRSFIVNRNETNELLNGNILNEQPVGSLNECLLRCANDVRGCQAIKYQFINVNLFPNCQLITYDNQNFQSLQSNTEKDAKTMYSAESICLTNAANCKNRPWLYELFSRKELINPSFAFRTFDSRSLEICLSSCLILPECKSAMFNKNSGQCRLLEISPNTVRLQGDYFRESNSWNLYENNCRGQEQLNERNCNFFRVKNTGVTNLYDVRKVGISSSNQCRDLCLNWNESYCRSYSYDKSVQVCYISHEGTKMFARSSLKLNDKNLEMADLDDCIDFELKCNQDSMLVIGDSLRLISGILKVKNEKLFENDQNCIETVRNAFHFEANFPYTGCGTTKLKSTSSTYSNLLFLKDSGTQLITVRDKLLQVVCRIHTSEDIDVSYKIHIENNNVTNEPFIVRPNQPTVLKPKFKLRVLDDNLLEAEQVNIGDTGYVQIDLDQTSAFSNVDFQVSDVVAEALDSGKKLQLYDHDGCPIDEQFVANFEHINNKQVRGKIQFFGFPNSTKLVFRGLVKPCIGKCETVSEKLFGVDYSASNFVMRQRTLTPKNLRPYTFLQICNKGSKNNPSRFRRSSEGPRSYFLTEEKYQVTSGNEVKINPQNPIDNRIIRFPQLLDLLNPEIRENGKKIEKVANDEREILMKQRLPGPMAICLTENMTCLVTLSLALLQALLICLCVCMIYLYILQVKRRRRIQQEIREQERERTLAIAVNYATNSQCESVRSDRQLVKD